MEQRAPHVKGSWNRWLTRFAGFLEMPKDVVMDLPKITLIGHLQVYVENHKGILEYTSRKIRVNTSRGVLVVTGRRLRIGSIFHEEMVIDGQVEHLEFLD